VTASSVIHRAPGPAGRFFCWPPGFLGDSRRLGPDDNPAATHSLTMTTLPRPALLTALVALFVTLATTSAGAQQPQQLPMVTLTAGMHNVRAQLATSPNQRQIGLMYRRDMPPNEGMLFVFEDASQQCFWMRNTLLPLSIAFVADDGTILNLADMKPLSEDSHCSSKPVRYALEMNAGWFAKRGIGPGFKLGGPPFARRSS
jgi:uncharacterized membrane protein (UPF0127 family)